MRYNPNPYLAGLAFVAVPNMVCSDPILEHCTAIRMLLLPLLIIQSILGTRLQIGHFGGPALALVGMITAALRNRGGKNSEKTA